MENQVLLAVPFFILMGTVLQRSRLAEDLLHTIGMLFGPRRGGLVGMVVRGDQASSDRDSGTCRSLAGTLGADFVSVLNDDGMTLCI